MSEKETVFKIEDEKFNGDPFNNLTLEKTEFHRTKDYNAFIRSVEGMLRKSPEYKMWRKFIIAYLGHSKCAFTGESAEQLTIEIHHHPIPLWDIIVGIVNTELQNHRPITTFIVAQKVMLLHYEGKVGYIPIIKSLHEKYHKGHLQIPMEAVRGEYKLFLKEYKQGIPEDMLKKINILETRTLNNVSGVNWTKDAYPFPELTNDEDIDDITDEQIEQTEELIEESTKDLPIEEVDLGDIKDIIDIVTEEVDDNVKS